MNSPKNRLFAIYVQLIIGPPGLSPRRPTLRVQEHTHQITDRGKRSIPIPQAIERFVQLNPKPHRILCENRSDRCDRFAVTVELSSTLNSQLYPKRVISHDRLWTFHPAE
jgi:hypothetical protein